MRRLEAWFYEHVCLDAISTWWNQGAGGGWVLEFWHKSTPFSEWKSMARIRKDNVKAVEAYMKEHKIKRYLIKVD